MGSEELTSLPTTSIWLDCPQQSRNSSIMMVRQRTYAFLPHNLCKPLHREKASKSMTTSSSSTTVVKYSSGVSQALTSLTQFSKRDNDRHYPEIFKSQASRALSTIPRWMKLREIDEACTKLRWNISGNFGSAKQNWNVVNSRIFRNLRGGKIGEPRRQYKSVVKSIRGFYIH